MEFRFVRRHSILAGAALLLFAVVLTMLFGDRPLSHAALLRRGGVLL